MLAMIPVMLTPLASLAAQQLHALAARPPALAQRLCIGTSFHGTTRQRMGRWNNAKRVQWVQANRTQCAGGSCSTSTTSNRAKCRYLGAMTSPTANPRMSTQSSAWYKLRRRQLHVRLGTGKAADGMAHEPQ